MPFSLPAPPKKEHKSWVRIPKHVSNLLESFALSQRDNVLVIVELAVVVEVVGAMLLLVAVPMELVLVMLHWLHVKTHFSSTDTSSYALGTTATSVHCAPGMSFAVKYTSVVDVLENVLDLLGVVVLGDVDVNMEVPVLTLVDADVLVLMLVESVMDAVVLHSSRPSPL